MQVHSVRCENVLFVVVSDFHVQEYTFSQWAQYLIQLQRVSGVCTQSGTHLQRGQTPDTAAKHIKRLRVEGHKCAQG